LRPFPCLFCTREAFFADLGNLIFSEMFDANQRVLCSAHSDEFIELCLNRCAIAILGIFE
jgi:hypothetical protein